MEVDTDVILTTKMKEKPERRRSSIFSLLKRQKKMTRQYSEPSQYPVLTLDRKFSVDSAISSDFTKIENGVCYVISNGKSDDIIVCDKG